MTEQFVKGLTTASLQGRAQIVPDPYFDDENHGDLVFYMDGAHSPESLEVCARWFSQQVLSYQPQVQSSHELVSKHLNERVRKQTTQVKYQAVVTYAIHEYRTYVLHSVFCSHSQKWRRNRNFMC